MAYIWVSGDPRFFRLPQLLPVGEVEVLPDWLGKVLRVLALAMIVGLVVLILSRWQVRRRTADLEDAHQALMVSERRYGEIFDSTSDAIFIHDAATGRLLEVNRSMLEMYGCTRAEALSHPVEAFCADVPPYTAREAAEYVVAAVADNYCRAPVQLPRRALAMYIGQSAGAMDLGAGPALPFSSLSNSSTPSNGRGWNAL